MKKNMILNFKHIIAVMIIGLIGLNFGCNKDFENTLPKSFKNDTAGLGTNTKKILYIVLDGVKGAVVSTLAPTTLTQITGNATYSYDGVADYQRNSITNAAAWTTMLTGVDYTKHNVTNENFANLNLQATPTIYTRLKTALGNVRTVSFGATPAFNDNLATDATVKQSFANDDAAVKTAVVNELNTNDPALLVAQFHSAEIAGAANGYTASTTAYAGAITTLDTYVGEILTALKARKNYSKENWLVVVASNKGGGVSGGTAGSNIFADESRNTFVAFYNPKFSAKPIIKPDVNTLPYVGVGAKFNATNAAVQSDPTFLNLGTNKEATIRFNLRWDNKAGNGNYPVILQKRGLTTATTAGLPGWALIKDDGGIITLNVSFTGSTGNLQAKGPTSQVITDGKWHSIAVRFYMNGTTHTASMFVDGIPAQTPNLALTLSSANGDLNTTSPLTFGKFTNVDCFITEFAVYNIAIPNADIIANSKKTPLLPAIDPYYNNLIGYFKGNEGSGNIINDVTGKAAPMNLVGSANWSNFADISPNLSPAISETAFTTVPNGIDIPVLIYNWFNISVPTQWNLMGKLYVPVISYSTN
jgi:hypothetical protein